MGTMDMLRVCMWFDDPACCDRSLTGGKAANLSRLAGLGRIPPGFCLTTAAFTLASATSQLPITVYNGLADSYQTLSQRCSLVDPAVAVRSSAVDEDSASASFAGQHETYLNIVGVDAISEAVVRCWASARSPRVLAYRRQQGLSVEGVQLAALVQQLIAADVSAVVFSANPVTGDRDEVVITASWGLGESIVGGLVTPDTYLVRKSNLAVASRQVADKRRMTVPVPGGTHEIDVPRFLREQPALEERQLVEAAHLALDLEQAMGCPVDVECCWGEGKLYLLQCRPITTLK